ncbi:MAG: rod shape-determining protein MreD [Candidatus Marinimicrobia bacterium]|nr:rod shape-determining protein MreD [Candidatus Neomarinimicrobiota bacterium]
MIFFNIIILLIVFFFQSIFPAIYFQSFKIYPDFLLIILLYFSFNNTRLASISIGFCIGFIQDLISEVELIGIYSFIKSLIGYLFGSLKKYDGFYSKKILNIFIFIIFTIHFSIYYFVKFNNIFDIIIFLKLVCINSIINMLLYFILHKIFPLLEKK